MVRRLKSDLRRLDPKAFPERIIGPITIAGLPAGYVAGGAGGEFGEGIQWLIRARYGIYLR